MLAGLQFGDPAIGVEIPNPALDGRDLAVGVVRVALTLDGGDPRVGAVVANLAFDSLDLGLVLGDARGDSGLKI